MIKAGQIIRPTNKHILASICTQVKVLIEINSQVEVKARNYLPLLCSDLVKSEMFCIMALTILCILP